jgi:hypothetical protein
MCAGRSTAVDPKASAAELAGPGPLAGTEHEEDLRKTFLAFLERGIEDLDAREARQVEWSAFVKRFSTEGVDLPANSDLDDIKRAARVVQTALAGRPIGWEFDQLIHAAHHLFDHHPCHLAVFMNLVRYAGHSAVLKQQDVSGTWGRKVSRLPALRAAHSTRFTPHLRLAELLVFLFPASEPVFERLRLCSRRIGLPHCLR